MAILIKDTAILTMTGTPLQSGDILVKEDKIAAIGQVPTALLDGSEEIIDGSGTVAMPGLVNTHTHASMTLLRSYADDMALMPWLNDKIWPAEAKMVSDHIYWGAMLAIAEMIRSGTTTFADMYGPYMERVAQAVAETGIRANLSRGCVGVADPDQQKIRENIQLYQEWHGAAEGRIQVRFGPHAPYTCSPDYITAIMTAAADLGAGIHVHLAETQDEIQQIQAAYGKTPTAYLNDLGVFAQPTLAAHCVYVSDEDIRILAEKQVGVAYNPASNMKLASGAAPVGKMLAAGLAVGFGTDGASSNNSLNLMRDITMGNFLQKVTDLSPTTMSADEALRLATAGGAQVLGIGQEVGTLAAGKKADIIMVDINQPHFCPWNNTIADLAYSAQGADVKNSIINGCLVMRDRQLLTMDLPRVMAEASACAREITR